MPNSAQLAARGREIAQTIKDINDRDDLSPAQKSEALDNIQGDWDSHMLEVKNSERASELLRPPVRLRLCRRLRFGT